MATVDTPDGFVHATSLADLQDAGRELVTTHGRAIALFYHEGEVRAVDNRCPHMGFPLSDGSVEEGVLTCHWHHARFELSCGDTFDPWADDVQTYPVAVRDGDVYVDPDPPRERNPAEHWADRLETGLEENLRLVVAKSVIGLRDAGVPASEFLERGVRFGTTYREDGWRSGLTILAALTNELPVLDADDQKRALYTGLRHVASDCAGEPPHFDQPAFDATDVRAGRLASWFRENVEVRDADGAERVLRTAVAACARDDADCTRADVEGMLYAAATDHAYLDTGHTFDMTNKAIETLDHLGWREALATTTGEVAGEEHEDVDGDADVDADEPGASLAADEPGESLAGDVLASLVTRYTDATRSDENSEWRQPEDLAAMRADFTDDLPALAAGDRIDWQAPTGFQSTLLGDDPHEIVRAIREAISNGASVAALAHEVASAAATRVARFGTTNEFSDWNTVHHTFTYANAVQQAATRDAPTELYRGVLDGAFSVYLDRFLNSPPASLPDPQGDDPDAEQAADPDAEQAADPDAEQAADPDAEQAADPDAEQAADPDTVHDAHPDDVRERLLDAFDREGAVNDAGEAAATLLAVADDAAVVWEALGSALLREDAGFHTLQAIEAAHAQFDAADDPERERVAVVAAARYLAAHTPTRREAEQTFTIASRLLRGESIHDD